MMLYVEWCDPGCKQVGLKSFVVSIDYRDYMGSSSKIWALQCLFLYLCSYNLVGFVTRSTLVTLHCAPTSLPRGPTISVHNVYDAIFLYVITITHPVSLFRFYHRLIQYVASYRSWRRSVAGVAQHFATCGGTCFPAQRSSSWLWLGSAFAHKSPVMLNFWSFNVQSRSGISQSPIHGQWP
jgi:hypothetical protein